MVIHLDALIVGSFCLKTSENTELQQMWTEFYIYKEKGMESSPKPKALLKCCITTAPDWKHFQSISIETYTSMIRSQYLIF